MADASTTLGMPQDLPVRLGNTLRPVVITVRIRAGALNPAGGGVVAALFTRATDMQPIGGADAPRFKVTRIGDNVAGEPRFRLELSKEDVGKLAAIASEGEAQSKTKSPVRIVYWTASFQASTGERYPLRYGKVVIVLGAASG